MDCYPPCADCSGLCRTEPRHPVGSEPSKKRARRVASFRPGYILLLCLHYTTPEEQVFVRARPPRGKRYWCEECSHWTKQVQQPKKKDTGTEPLF